MYKAETAKGGRFYEWARGKAHSPRAPLWLTFLFSLELILFIPLDAVLMFFCLQNRQRTWLYVSLCAMASICSAAIGYFLGHLLWDLIGSFVVPYLISASFFHQISLHFEMHETLAAFFGALIPFPLKALTLTAGVFHLALPPFLCAVGLARLLRFGIVGGVMFFWGTKVQPFVEKHFYRILIVLGLKAVMIFVALWALVVG